MPATAAYWIFTENAMLRHLVSVFPLVISPIFTAFSVWKLIYRARALSRPSLCLYSTWKNPIRCRSINVSVWCEFSRFDGWVARSQDEMTARSKLWGRCSQHSHEPLVKSISFFLSFSLSIALHPMPIRFIFETDETYLSARLLERANDCQQQADERARALN